MTILPQKVNWWYESIVDWMLLNPHKTKTDAAQFFGVSKYWMYQLTNSDVFKALYEERRAKHNGMVSSAVIEKTSALTEMALDHLADRVAQNGSVMSPELLKDISEMGLEKLGYDGKYRPTAGPAQQVNVNVMVTNADDLAEARARLESRGKEIAANASSPHPAVVSEVLPPPTEPITPLKAMMQILEGEE